MAKCTQATDERCSSRRWLYLISQKPKPNTPNRSTWSAHWRKDAYGRRECILAAWHVVGKSTLKALSDHLKTFALPPCSSPFCNALLLVAKLEKSSTRCSARFPKSTAQHWMRKSCVHICSFTAGTVVQPMQILLAVSGVWIFTSQAQHAYHGL